MQTLKPFPAQDLVEARTLCIFADSVTTDLISPTGAITETSPAGSYLIESGVDKSELNAFDSPCENDEVLARRTFDHPQIKNLMTRGIAGGYTQYFGDAPVPAPAEEITATAHAQPTFIYHASIAYQQTGRKLIIIAGADYGSGAASSGDWAAKGTALLGVQAVVAKSIAPSHCSQLIKAGVLPLTFKNQEDYHKIKDINSWTSTFSITGLTEELKPNREALLTTSCGLSLPLFFQ